MAGAPNAANTSTAARQQASLQSGRTPNHVPGSGEQAPLKQAQLPKGLRRVTLSPTHPDVGATAGRQAHPESGGSSGHVPGTEGRPGMAACSQGELSGCLWGHTRDTWAALETQRDPVVLQVVGPLAS